MLEEASQPIVEYWVFFKGLVNPTLVGVKTIEMLIRNHTDVQLMPKDKSKVWLPAEDYGFGSKKEEVKEIVEEIAKNEESVKNEETVKNEVLSRRIVPNSQQFVSDCLSTSDALRIMEKLDEYDEFDVLTPRGRIVRVQKRVGFPRVKFGEYQMIRGSERK